MKIAKYRPIADRKPLTKKRIAELKRKLKDKNYLYNACEVMSNRIARHMKGGSCEKK